MEDPGGLCSMELVINSHNNQPLFLIHYASIGPLDNSNALCDVSNTFLYIHVVEQYRSSEFMAFLHVLRLHFSSVVDFGHPDFVSLIG